MRFFILLVLSLLMTHAVPSEPATESVKLIAPAVSTGTGLLLQPALTLPDFTREKFEEAMATVGLERIHKSWTSPVVALPPHPRTDVHGLTMDEVKDYMVSVK